MTLMNSSTQIFKLGHKQIRLTHLDRVYFPTVGLTKKDLVDYYLDISPVLLSHLHERPLTLERWPEGIEEGWFYQKDAGSYFPSWIKTYAVPTKDEQKIVHYPLVEDKADLLYLVNLGTITFHTQLSRISDIEHPDIMVLDIDPPEIDLGQHDSISPFGRAAEVALLLRTEFQSFGIDLLAKTSGKRGIHLAFSLKSLPGFDKPDFSEARQWLKEVFAKLTAKYPRLLTTEIRKEKRRGRVYLDALRMSRGATIVPPYVVRATAMATVSTPVTWDEIAQLEDPSVFTIKTVPDRVAKLGDLWGSLVTQN